MKLAEALRIVNQYKSSPLPLFHVQFCCGFTPLHLGMFFQAQMQQQMPARKIDVHFGLFGDLIGNVQRAASAPHRDVAVVVFEWQDIEPRLGYRQLGGWLPSQADAIVEGFSKRLSDLAAVLLTLRAAVPVVLALPSLRLPPVFHPPTAKASFHALQLQSALSSFAVHLSQHGVTIVNTDALDQSSPASTRHDLKSELSTGFPYSISHAAELAGLIAAGFDSHRSPKKGLITDLDDTLWQGILGEVGPQGVHWTLEQHSQLHGLYQQLLASLAEQGVLIAIASKNDAALVTRTFTGERPDLLLPPAGIFPLEVHWGQKSESVSRILQTWNIGADSVVFVDDSPLELAEVKAAHPLVETIQFPKADYAAAAALFFRLRDLFGKDTTSAEDRIRLQSIRRAHEFTAQTAAADRQEEFLAGLDAVLTFTINPPPSETRVLELVNKTNQFNLNGKRYSEADWQRLRQSDGSLVLAIGYADRFGPLGTIAVLAGTISGTFLQVHAWVMSCRAFSRRIEFQTLRFVFSHFGLSRIGFDYEETARNGPLRDAFEPLLGAAPKNGPLELEQASFEPRCPPLSHRVEVR